MIKRLLNKVCSGGPNGFRLFNRVYGGGRDELGLFNRVLNFKRGERNCGFFKEIYLRHTSLSKKAFERERRVQGRFVEGIRCNCNRDEG